MIKTILVDDDYLVRMYLLASANWEEVGFEIVADVQDGEQALEKIEELHPELVITDISMPVMDGIELIKEIKSRQIPCTTVALSCHDSFHHVKEALKYGADDYILKNEFKNENIYKILENLKNKVITARKETEERRVRSELADLGSNELKKKFLNKISENDYDYHQLQENAQKYGIRLSLLKTAVAEIKLLQHVQDDDSSEIKRVIFSNLIKLCDEVLGRDYWYELISKSEYEYTLLLDGNHIADLLILNTIASDLYNAIDEILQLPFAIGLSDICIGKNSLKHAYTHAKQAIECSFYQSNKIYHYEPENSLIRHRTSFLSFYDEIRKRLVSSDIQGVIELAEKQVSRFEKEIAEPEIVINWIRELDTILKVERKSEEYEKIIHIDQIKKIVEHYKEHIWSYPNIEAKISNILVAKTIEYIIQNYRKSISLSEVAEYLKVNATYLSRIFKQETKTNFTDYLTMYRIESAKELLNNTNKKIKDISVECGFFDYRYFCKIFKKSAGQSPLSYRRTD